jgi:hypothetical protein
LPAIEWDDRQEVENGPKEADENEDVEEVIAVVAELGEDGHQEKDGEAEQDLDAGAGGGDEEALLAVEESARIGGVTAEGLESDGAVGPEGPAVRAWPSSWTRMEMKPARTKSPISRMAAAVSAVAAPPRMMREIQKKGWISTGMPKTEKRIM